jgi:hypothetical protein
VKLQEVTKNADVWTFKMGVDEGDVRTVKGDAARVIKAMFKQFHSDAGYDSAESQEEAEDLISDLRRKETDPAIIFRKLVMSDIVWDGYDLELNKNGKKIPSGGRHN